MAEFNSAEKIISNTFAIEQTNVMTGDDRKERFLLYQLKMSIANAKKIDIIVSFLMESGVRLLLKDLKIALERGAKLRLLTGNYLGITQPSALYLIKKELGEQIDLRFYHDKERSFHPKAYLFHYENYSEIYIGSSNVSKSALTSGIEWNYRFSNTTDAYHTIGRKFLALIETTQMQKVYKMPVLYAFYNDGDVQMELTEEALLKHWRNFFSNGMNWKDLQSDSTYAEYQKISNKKHLSNIKQNPVKFLKSSGKGFFVEKEGYVIALREELRPIIGKVEFKNQMKDIIEYRTMEYYRRRYLET